MRAHECYMNVWAIYYGALCHILFEFLRQKRFLLDLEHKQVEHWLTGDINKLQTPFFF